MYAEQGQYKKAIQLTREAIKMVPRIDEQNVIASLASLSDYYSNIGDTVRAFMLLDSALAMNPDMDNERWLYEDKGYLYAGRGNQEELKRLIDTLNMPVKQIGILNSWSALHHLKAELFRLQGNIEKAMIEYDKLGIYSYSFYFDLKAKFYGDAEDWENVILTANDMQATFLYGDILVDPRNYSYPRAYYIRGKAYEEMGKSELAIENYEALLELWKDADEEIPELKNTIKRLAALKQES